MTSIMNALQYLFALAKDHPTIAWPLITALVTVALKPRSPAQYAAMAAMRPVWFWSRFTPLLQLVGALGLDPVKALQVIGKVFTGKQDSAIPPKLLPLGVVALVLSVSACGITPKQASDGATAACDVLKVFADSPAEEAICATAPELAAITAAVAASQQDAGPGRGVVKCTPLPKSTVCATDAQLAAQIRAVKAQRGGK